MKIKYSKKIPDIIIIKPDIYEDSRGFFFESYNQKKYGLKNNFFQDNISYSKAGTIRGLHFQDEPMAQAKLVRVVQGKVFDVAVDLRKNSSTFGQHVGIILSEKNKCTMYIPKGFAHGFMAIEDSIFMYKVDNYHSIEHENSIFWADISLDIKWPSIKNNFIVSAKDQANQSFKTYSHQINSLK